MMKTVAADDLPGKLGLPPVAKPEDAVRLNALVLCLVILSLLCGLVGLVLGLLFAPASASMGETYRIILVHVPASWLAMLIYLVMAAGAADCLLRNHSRSGAMLQAMAPTGTLMALLSLGTGALWGQPTWGTGWAWDPRLTSMLTLFFFYLGFIALTAASKETHRAVRTGSFLVLMGVVNIPIIHFSVHWWPSLHQGTTITLNKSAPISPLMLWGLLLMLFCFAFYAAAMTLLRLGNLTILEDHALE